MIVQTIDRRVNPVMNLTLVGGVSVVADAGAAVLDEDVLNVALADPAYLASLPEGILVVLGEDSLVAVLSDEELGVRLEEDDVNVETCQ